MALVGAMTSGTGSTDRWTVTEPGTFRGGLHPSPRAEALREYADRWHSTTEGVSIRTDYGAGIEWDAVCQCGVVVAEDGCPERQQLLGVGEEIEQGRDFQDVADAR